MPSSERVSDALQEIESARLLRRRGETMSYLCPNQASDARTEDRRNAFDFSARIDCMESKGNGYPDEDARKPTDDKRFHHARHASRWPNQR